MERLVLIALGGAIGTVLRYVTSLFAVRWFGPEFPYGTLLVNLSGAFIVTTIVCLCLCFLGIAVGRLFLSLRG